ncbi:MAG: hypothetical protein WCI63_00775 [bacterium]
MEFTCENHGTGQCARCEVCAVDGSILVHPSAKRSQRDDITCREVWEMIGAECDSVDCALDHLNHPRGPHTIASFRLAC